MTDPWGFRGQSPTLGPAGVVTLVEGSSFCISDRSGDLQPESAHGLFFRDTRFLSRFELRLNGHRPEALSASVELPFAATYVARGRPRAGRADSTLLVFRHRYVGRGMREDLSIRNYGEEPSYCVIELLVDADFADLFEVKENRVERRGDHEAEHGDDVMQFRWRRGATNRGTSVRFDQTAVLEPGQASFEVVIPPRGEWRTCVEVTPIIDGEAIPTRHPCGEPVERADPAQRLARWRQMVPAVQTDHAGLRALVAQSGEDLGALRIFDPERPDRAVVAAGAPWFMTLFGRDSLITSYMALGVDPDLALGVLETLARFQGEEVDERTEEEPGRILHEMRFGSAPSLALGGGQIYYGTADATPLFVMLLGELRRWGLADDAVERLLPHADRALAWITDYGDRDGDGYVEYERATDRGLQNQGWKDSFDGVRFANGRLARAPVALCEVQGYVYAAFVARAHFAGEAGDHATSLRWRTRAAELKAAFNRDFWLPEQGWFAMGLDAEKQPIDALASNMGHCLWTGIVDEDKAAQVAAHLLSPEMFSGWGVRTLATSMTGYNPLSYHNGSVWPHDSALVAAGLMRYGFVDEAHRVILALLDAGVAHGWRLPELFSGLERDDVATPVSYPTSCSPQAWAAAAPLLFLRTLLRFDPWIPQGKLWVAPVLPPEIGELRVERIPLAGSRVTVEVTDGTVRVVGLPPGITLEEGPRTPLTGELPIAG